MESALTIELPGPLLLVSAGRRHEPALRCRPGAVALNPQFEQLAGRLAGRLAAERQAVTEAGEALEAAAGRLQTLQAELRARAEQEVAALAVDVARKVLAQEVEAGRYRVDPIVAEALASVTECPEVTVHLKPKDLARCEQASQAANKSESRIRFVADDTVPPAGCTLHTPEGAVVSSVDKSVDRIADALSSSE